MLKKASIANEQESMSPHKRDPVPLTDDEEVPTFVRKAAKKAPCHNNDSQQQKQEIEQHKVVETDDECAEEPFDKFSKKSLPKSNKEYGSKEYWEQRFQGEEEYDWLLSFQQLSSQLLPFLRPESRILVIGCGNSPFSADLYDAGFTNIVNIDYSANVIERMVEKHAEQRPKMQWRVMDMTDMSDLEATSFDVVIDKATMDALMTLEGDVWYPNECVIASARAMCRHVSRILVPSGGAFLQISLTQPHFRKKYLLGWHNNELGTELDQTDDTFSKEFEWSFRFEIAGEPSESHFEHYLYIMAKKISDSRQ